MGNNGARADREMQSLIRKMQRLARKKSGASDDTLEDEPGTRRRTAYVDRAGASDVRVEDASADEIFREMKRRDF